MTLQEFYQYAAARYLHALFFALPLKEIQAAAEDLIAARVHLNSVM
jgi:hypothetical protein